VNGELLLLVPNHFTACERTWWVQYTIFTVNKLINVLFTPCFNYPLGWRTACDRWTANRYFWFSVVFLQ